MARLSLCLSLFLLVLVSVPVAGESIFREGVRVGDVSRGFLGSKATGLASSRVNYGVLWVHSEAGVSISGMTIFGSHLASFELQNTAGKRLPVDFNYLNHRFQDMAVGPGPLTGVSYLYVLAVVVTEAEEPKESLRVYRVPEPLVSATGAAQPGMTPLPGAQTITLAFSDDGKDSVLANAKTLLVDPWSGEITLVIEEEGDEAKVVYATPANTAFTRGSHTVSLELKGPLNWRITEVKGGDVSPDGNDILIRSNIREEVHYYSRLAYPLVSQALVEGIPFPHVNHPPGEAIAFAADNSGYYTLSDAPTISVYYYVRDGTLSPTAQAPTPVPTTQAPTPPPAPLVITFPPVIAPKPSTKTSSQLPTIAPTTSPLSNAPSTLTTSPTDADSQPTSTNPTESVESTSDPSSSTNTPTPTAPSEPLSAQAPQDYPSSNWNDSTSTPSLPPSDSTPNSTLSATVPEEANSTSEPNTTKITDSVANSTLSASMPDNEANNSGEPNATLSLMPGSNGTISMSHATTVPDTMAEEEGRISCQTNGILVPPQHSQMFPLQVVGNNGRPENVYPMGLCQGDCDIDRDCLEGMFCLQRTHENDTVPSYCTGAPDRDIDYCVLIEGYFLINATTNHTGMAREDARGAITITIPCVDMDGDVVTRAPTSNPTQSPTAPTPSPTGSPTAPTSSPSGSPTAPTSSPSGSPTAPTTSPSGSPSTTTSSPTGPTEYIPGLLTHLENGLLLSSGLRAKIIATSGLKVQYHNGDESDEAFHGRPDFGGTFVDQREGNQGGWVYVSNSELDNGGVGGITFDQDGNVIDYKMLLTGTHQNCGGGKTPFGTWVTCEEIPNGNLYQVDPMDRVRPQRLTLGQDGGRFESFAYDVRDPLQPQFFVTQDLKNGVLQRFIPVPTERRQLDDRIDTIAIIPWSRSPTTESPSSSPTTTSPTITPTSAPTQHSTPLPTIPVVTSHSTTAGPTTSPLDPIPGPTTQPTVGPTALPSNGPISVLTESPTDSPTASPTAVPSVEPTAAPSAEPTASPTNYVYDHFWDLYDDDSWEMLHGPGRIYYLVLEPESDESSGTFHWSTDKLEGENNAEQFYPQSEGIDVYDGKLYFVCKAIKMLFTLDLDRGTYIRETTRSGLFDGQPDQLQKILFEGDEEFIFFTEEGGTDAGIHGRDFTGVFYTLLESPDYHDETTGLAFSPDMKHMYVAYQENGLLFDIYRFDGLPFSATSLNLKSHST